jgi:inner membrane protein
MASAFSHAIASVAIGKISTALGLKPNPLGVDRKFWWLAIFCAVIPDIDAIGFWMGVPYDSVWGHRGITHSLFFAILLALVVTYLFYGHEKKFNLQWWALFFFFFVATASHGMLDAMTNGGKGIAFFAPFYDERYFFFFRPIKVSPISITRFFTGRGWVVLQSEFIWVWIPSFVVMGVAEVVKRMK